ncbi:hypothetical protein ES707_20525 [subsurface metagenome]
MGLPNENLEYKVSKNPKSAPAIDKPIFIMLDYSIMKLMCTKMFNASHGAERNAFVFTVRTEVRLGGLSYAYLA